MRLLGCFFLVAVGALAQAGAPLFFPVTGPLSCGLRLYQPGLVQEYCYSTAPVLKIVCNAVQEIMPVTAGDAPPIAGSQSCFATVVDPVAQTGTIHAVTWLVWQPIIAVPPGSTGTIKYQIAYSTFPCTVDQTSGCVGNGQPGTMDFRQGSFSSGILAAGLVRFDVDGGPTTIIDVKPDNAQWNAAVAPGMAAITTTGLAHVVTPTGLCAVASQQPGTAQLAETAGALEVGWQPTGACQQWPAIARPLALAGNCTPLATTFSTNPDGTICYSVPASPTGRLMNLVMFPWSEAPTFQGR